MRALRARALVAVTSALVVVPTGGCASKPAATALPLPPPAPGPWDCEALRRLALPHGNVTDARTVAAKAPDPNDRQGVPAYCRVIGVSRPTKDSDIRFEVMIPSKEAWNRRYLQVGNGGFAGSLPVEDILEGLAAGYAVAGTDDGHQSSSFVDASWATGHPEKVIDFGYRALKETTESARAIIRAYTGQAPAHSYFQGCSNGGREALMEAQRYPGDFDGVVAGAPANHWTHTFMNAAWDEQALLETPASYVPPSKLKALEAAALAACGDGDGVVEDPLGCHFDPAILLCKGADDDRCLSAPQIKAVRAIYAGPRNPRTSETIFPGFEPGSEAESEGWQGWIVGRAPGLEGGAALYQFAHNFFGYVVFGDPSYDIRRFRFDADVTTTDAKAAAILNATDIDLGPFQRRGGKLIQYHGWGDPAIPPRNSIAYYEGVSAKLGDVGAFYRLFMAPGMLHCGGGAGPNVISTLPAIVEWVEAGKAPERLIAAKMSGQGASERVAQTRPLCPHPRVAVWDGKGDRARAESYVCSASSRGPR